MPGKYDVPRCFFLLIYCHLNNKGTNFDILSDLKLIAAVIRVQHVRIVRVVPSKAIEVQL